MTTSTATSPVLFASEDAQVDMFDATNNLGVPEGMQLATSDQLAVLEARDTSDVFAASGFVPPMGAQVALEEQLAAARLDEPVETATLYHRFNGNLDKASILTKTGRSSSITCVRNAKTGDVYAPAKNVYKPIQALDIAQALSPIVDSGLGTWDGVLRLRHGAVGVVRVKLNNVIKVRGDESPLQEYLNAVICHDLSMTNSFYESCIRPVCQNTLRRGLADARKEGKIYAIKHTSKGEEKIEQAKAALQLAAAKFQAFEAWANRLVDVKVTDAQFSAFVEKMLPSKKDEVSPQLVTARDTLRKVYHGPTQNGIRGNLWGVYQAATEYADHWTRMQGGATERTDSILFGRASNMKDTVTDMMDGILEGELVL